MSTTARTTNDGPCVLDLYLDGARTADADLNQVPPEWLEGIEIYAGPDTPTEYSGPNPCGVVLLWTRR